MGQLSGPTDPTRDANWTNPEQRKGFFTDTSICIGCKACEVACKEWNHNPRDGELELLGSSYDNTGALGASTWRHVAFIEQGADRIDQARESGRALVSLGMPGVRGGGSAEPQPAAAHTAPPDTGPPNIGPPNTGPPDTGPPDTGPPDAGPPDAGSPNSGPPDTAEFRWLMSSDVCKHCTHAGCLDVCPTGALFRTEFGTVVVQDDVCNGCGTCVAGCPFGVIERRDDGTVSANTRHAAESADVPNVGVAQKCTLCYDRLVDGQTPACAQTCPTTSIKFGDHEDLVTVARERVRELHAQGMTEARLYGANELDGVGGTGAVFLLLDEPEVYGLPPDPCVPTADLPRMFNRAGVAAMGMIAAVVASFLTRRRR